MKLSSKCMYAFRALFDIAYHGGGQPVSGRDIAEREEVPQRFLEQILLELKRAGLVRSKRGPNGGYSLAKSPDEITMLDAVEAIEGPIPVSFCYATDDEARRRCQITNKCVTAALWRDIAEVIQDKLRSITLSDVVRRGEALGVGKEGESAYFYVI